MTGPSEGEVEGDSTEEGGHGCTGGKMGTETGSYRPTPMNTTARKHRKREEAEGFSPTVFRKSVALIDTLLRE